MISSESIPSCHHDLFARQTEKLLQQIVPTTVLKPQFTVKLSAERVTPRKVWLITPRTVWLTDWVSPLGVRCVQTITNPAHNTHLYTVQFVLLSSPQFTNSSKKYTQIFLIYMYARSSTLLSLKFLCLFLQVWSGACVQLLPVVLQEW